jgi:hypothetical protein
VLKEDTTMRKYLAFDIEIATQIPDGVHDWKGLGPLGVSCAATLSSDASTSSPIIWFGGDNSQDPSDRLNKEELSKLITYLEQMESREYNILTWNGLGFDFRVLSEEGDFFQECSRLALNHIDMMFHIFCTLGYAVSLDSAARGTGVPGKPAGMTGYLAPKLWAEGNRKSVLDYVGQDVRTTLQLAQGCENKRRMCWIARSGNRREMPLQGGWLTVHKAMELPLPDTSWMDDPWPRSKFAGWLREGT